MSRRGGALVRLGRWLLSRVATSERNRQGILGDLDELYNDRLDAGAGFSADVWYVKEAAVSAVRLRAHRPLLGTVIGASVLDIKLGVRMLRKEPMLTGVAVLALGLGIPASLSVTHVWNAVMAPLPHDQGERIVGIRNWDLEANRPAPRALHDFAIWREELTSFQAVAASRSTLWNVHSEDGRAEPVRGAEITGSAFDILRVPPLHGRTLAAPDEVVGGPDVVVVGADIWESRFGRDPEIVGKTIRIGSVPHTVVGVMPEGFLFPQDDHLWLPLRADPPEYQRGDGPVLQVFGRLADGVSTDQASAEAQTVGRRLAVEYPDTHGRLAVEVVTMPILALAWSARTNITEIFSVQFGSLVLLLIVCGNVSIMILARTATRTGEIAVRTALGASRVRIVSLLFVEALVLALLATALGLFVAHWSARQFEALLDVEFPYWMDMGLTLRSVLLALGLAVICAGVASIVPALKATGRGIQGNLQRSAARGSGIRFGAGSTALIVAEVALSIGFLSLGAALARTVFQNTSGKMGIELEDYLAAELRVPLVDPTLDQAETYLDDYWNRVRATQLELKRRLESEPGVRSVAMARAGDLPGEHRRARYVEVEGDLASGASLGLRVGGATVDVDFFRDLGRPILDGRSFDAADIPQERDAHRDAVIVNTTFVEQVLGGGGPIGKRIRYQIRNGDPSPWYVIVGLVGPLGMNPTDPESDAGIYHPAGPGEVHPVGFVIEVGDDPVAFTPRLRAIAAEVDPSALIQRPRLLSDLGDFETSANRLASLALMLLSVIAIILSASGLYALMSFTVAQRTREIGIRTALGARPWSVISTIVRRAVVQLMLGVVFGAAFAAYALAIVNRDEVLKPQSWPLVVMAVVAGTVLVGGIACLMPTLRGLRIQPTEALREG